MGFMFLAKTKMATKIKFYFRTEMKTKTGTHFWPKTKLSWMSFGCFSNFGFFAGGASSLHLLSFVL